MAYNALVATEPFLRPVGQPIIHPAATEFRDGILRRDGNNVLQGYMRINERVSIPCGHGRGVILFCLEVTRSSPQDDFQPTENVVVVKKLLKSAIPPNAQEDPYQEIHLMKEYGDNQHISKIIDALETKKHLFIIMPWLGHDLFSEMWGPRDEEQRPIYWRPWNPAMVRVLLLNLQYFQNHALILRDVSPDNIISSVDGFHMPHIDLAMGLQCKVIDNNPRRIRAGQPWCGKWPYTAPEVLLQMELGFALDMWSMAVTILNIAIGEQYTWDLRFFWFGQVDPMYDFLIIQGALNNPQMLMSLVESLNNINANMYRDMVRKLRSIYAMDFKLRNLLAIMLKPNAEDRPTIDELLAHPYFWT